MAFLDVVDGANSADPCHGWVHAVLHHPHDVPY